MLKSQNNALVENNSAQNILLRGLIPSSPDNPIDMLPIFVDSVVSKALDNPSKVNFSCRLEKQNEDGSKIKIHAGARATPERIQTYQFSDYKKV